MDKLSATAALEKLGGGETYRRLIAQADFDVGMYRPVKEDDQTPHRRDEIYIVAAGTGDFVCAGECSEFASGDIFFVPAGIEHRFQNFSQDFATWVVFMGARR
jgi:mannose-6-phosphate isomerase-like protein (cupin superfamily)